jgi:hypothetical protein
MDHELWNTIGTLARDIAFIVAGCLIIRYRKAYARRSTAFQHKVFGFRYTKQDVQMNARTYALFGTLCITVGILSRLGIIW